MGYYSVKMVKKADECYTFCSAGTMRRAAQLTEQSWGEGWRAAEVKPAEEFYQVLNAGSEEEAAELLALRVANLKRGISKVVVTPKGEFASLKDAAAAYQQPTHQFRSKVGKEKGFYFKED